MSSKITFCDKIDDIIKRFDIFRTPVRFHTDTAVNKANIKYGTKFGAIVSILMILMCISYTSTTAIDMNNGEKDSFLIKKLPNDFQEFNNFPMKNFTFWPSLEFRKVNTIDEGSSFLFK